MHHVDHHRPESPDPEQPAIVFLHAALGDRRMWHPQWNRFQASHELVAIDSRGFGAHPPTRDPFSRSEEVLNALRELGVQRAVVVGASMGGRVAAEVAVRAPDLVAGVMFLAAPLPAFDPSEATQACWRSEAEAVEAGDIDQAVKVNLDYWLDGPNRDQASVSDRDRNLVADMQRAALLHELALPDAAAETRMQDLVDRLPEIEVPSAVLYGTEDATEFHELAEQLAALLPKSTLHAINNTAHLPSLEAPDEVNELLDELLARLSDR